MPTYELLRFDSPSSLAQAAAASWLDALQAAPAQDQPRCVALSGGRIAQTFFSAIVENARKRAVSLARVHFFWADERCVPPSDAESNFALAEKWLLRPLQIAANRVHRISGEIRPEDAAREASAELRRVAPPNAAGQPVLDTLFLGMGEDGHVASLFPDTPVGQIDLEEVYKAVTGSKPPPQRVTLTYGAISAAREVWVLASGPGKAEALRASLGSGDQTPLGRVLRMRGQTKIFTDIVLAETVEKAGLYPKKILLKKI